MKKYLCIGYSGKRFVIIFAKSLYWYIPLVQRYLPDADVVSNNSTCALATSLTCTQPSQWYSCESFDPNISTIKINFSFIFVN